MTTQISFKDLNLHPKIQQALNDLGYEVPTPVQAESIPALLDGRNLLGLAQTGTGKTAAFALPIITRLNFTVNEPQAIILAPTRELAIQVAETFQSYAKFIPEFKIITLYGGAAFSNQLTALKRGVHVVVGTPGRVMDHLRRGTLKMQNIKMIVLDEADEMLKMGFIDDVKWILDQIPGEPQTALFSATMPNSIRQVTNRYLKDAKEVHISPKVKTVAAIEQFYTMVSKANKLGVLIRILEVEKHDAVLIFARTKNATSELSMKLSARGYSVAAINGDMNQGAREKVIQQLKEKNIDILVATDVAARGLDVERISHVINYDIPYDPESYVHRIGRTGRAGRQGKAFLLVHPREERMLADIERAIQQKLMKVPPPSAQQINEKREATFTNKILAALTTKDLDAFRDFIQTLAHDSEHSIQDLAAALASVALNGKPLKIKEDDSFFVAEAHEDEQSENTRRRPSRGNGQQQRSAPKRKFGNRMGGAKKESTNDRGGDNSGRSKPRKEFSGKKFSGKDSGANKGRSTTQFTKKPRNP